MGRGKTKWRWIPGFKGIYKINRKGKIRSVDRYVKRPRGFFAKLQGMSIKATVNNHGYQVVSLAKNGTSRQYQVHQLVLLTFRGPKPLGLLSRHLDGDRLNNKLSNLQYGTSAENKEDSRQHGTMPIGEGHNSSRLTNKKVRRIRKLNAIEKLTKERIQELSVLFKVNPRTIKNVMNDKFWKHVK